MIDDLLTWATGQLTAEREAAIRADLDAEGSRIRQLIDILPTIKELATSFKSEQHRWLEKNKADFIGPLTEEQRAGILALERVLAASNPPPDTAIEGFTKKHGRSSGGEDRGRG